MRLFFVLALALLLPACASVPMASADAEAQGKAFAPPPPDKAALYVYREGIFGAAKLLSCQQVSAPSGRLLRTRGFVSTSIRAATTFVVVAERTANPWWSN